MGTYRCDYCNRKEAASGSGYSLPWGWTSVDGRHFCSSTCVREFKEQQLREMEEHNSRLQEEQMQKCEYCNKKYLIEHGGHANLSDGSFYRRYHFCSRACFANMMQHFQLEECDENGRVSKTKHIEKEQDDPYADLEEIDPTKFKWDDEDEGPKVSKPGKKEKKEVAKSKTQEKELPKKSKKDIKQERKQRVQGFYDMMNKAKKSK